MLDKFQCSYKLTINWIDINGQPMQNIITDPITIDFQIVKSTRSQNSTRINIYNMDAGIRENVYKDIILLRKEEPIKWVTLEAGYAGRKTLISWGYIQQCFSVRKGTDFITSMEVIDPDILTEYCGVTFKEGTTFQQAYDYLITQLPSLKVGETGVLAGEFKVPTTFDGNAFILLNELTGQHTFVDNGVINTLNDNETLSDYGCYYIAGDTGLLETPKRYDDVLEISMLFEPTIKLGQMVEIKSSTQARFNGQYKVLGINHNCVISGAEGGTRTTTLQLQYIYGLTNSNINLTDEPSGSEPAVVKNNTTTPITTKISSAVQSIYKQIMKFNGDVPKNPITNLINWHQMIYASSKNTPAAVKSSITLDKLKNCENIAEKLTDFLNIHFKGHKISITSGYRTPQSNSKIEASAKNSNHIKGAAIDFWIPTVPMTKLRKVFQDNWKYGLGIYLKNNFIHVSLNPRERFIVKERV